MANDFKRFAKPSVGTSTGASNMQLEDKPSSDLSSPGSTRASVHSCEDNIPAAGSLQFSDRCTLQQFRSHCQRGMEMNTSICCRSFAAAV